MSEVEIPYGWEVASGRIVHVDDAFRGKACNCVCPGCGSSLIAKKGEKKANHFAHAGGCICKGYLETLIHKTSKQIIKDANTIRVPSLALYEIGLNGRIQKKYPIIDTSSQFIKYDSCAKEEQIRREYFVIQPDLILKKGERSLIVEITVTHPIDSEKESKIIELGYSALEINLSWVGIDFVYAELRKTILNTLNYSKDHTTVIPFKKWINNEKFNALASRLRNSGKHVSPDTASGPHPYNMYV